MSLFDSLIGAAGSIGGALIGSSANKKANKKAAKAMEEANRIREKGIDQATTIYREQQEQAAPAVRYLRDVIANPINGLYPDQVAAQQDMRRQAENQLARSGLRGSGRAVTASLKQVDSDFVNNALAQNRQSRQGAAAGLAGQSFAAGNNTANALINGSNSAATTTENIGTNAANTGTANAGLWGNALGDIGSLIASEVKGRSSSYDGSNVPGRTNTNNNDDDPWKLNKGGMVRKKSRLAEVVRC